VTFKVEELNYWEGDGGRTQEIRAEQQMILFKIRKKFWAMKKKRYLIGMLQDNPQKFAPV
jgi:hypothetical protein